jgi:L-iditol 2-dehydrogenase
VDTQMIAAVLYGKENLQIESVSVPKIEKGDVLVRVQAALTCGTDVKVFRRGYHARMIVPPALFGHELAGDIVAVGPDVRTFSVGQRVVAANSAPCMECFYCKRGSENLCEDLLFNNGAYAEYIRIPARIVERNMYEMPAHVSYQDAALVEPLACVLRGLDETSIRAGDSLAVIGLGPIGLMFVRLAKAYGARVIAIGRRKPQLDRAARMGADELLLSGDPDATVQRVRNLTGERGADIAIEAVGHPDTWETAVRILRRGGIVNFFGGCPNDSRISLDTALLHYSEITCKASFHHTPAHIRKALDFVSRGVISARDFVNREEPLTNLLEVMRHLMSHNGHMKTAIIP